MTDFSFGFTDDFDFGWGFSTAEADDRALAFGAAPQPGHPNPPVHRRSKSANAGGTSDPFGASPDHKRCGSDPLAPDVQTRSEFAIICQDPFVRFNPRHLAFIPACNWPERELTFGDLVADHFQKKSGSNTRFFHKLYNALKIADFDPFYTEFVGVEWVNERVIKIHKKKFARLLGIRTIDGSLFHQQGNFPSHGFRELGPQEAKAILSPEDLADVDYDVVRLLVHAPGDFVRTSSSQVFERCRWINSRQK
jgi:hypothetical protein